MEWTSNGRPDAARIERKDREMINRSDINRKLGKALAYADLGKHADAADWAFDLLKALDQAGIINVVTVDGNLVAERPARAQREAV
jgi:hypothetical protein